MQDRIFEWWPFHFAVPTSIWRDLWHRFYSNDLEPRVIGVTPGGVTYEYVSPRPGAADTSGVPPTLLRWTGKA